MAGPGLGSKNKQKQGSNGSPLMKGAGTKQPAKRLGGVPYMNSGTKDVRFNAELSQLMKHAAHFAESELEKNRKLFFEDYNTSRTRYLADRVREDFNRFNSLNQVRQDSFPNKKDRYTYSKPGPWSGGSKIGVSASGSVGAQYGSLAKLAGIGVGFFVNLSSYDIVSGELSSGGNTKVSTFKSKSVKKAGAEISFVAVGAEFGIEEEEDKQNHNTSIKNFVGVNLGPVKIIIESIDEYIYNHKSKKFIKKYSYTRPMLSLFRSEAKGAFGLKGEIKGEILINLRDFTGDSGMRIQDSRPWETRADATQVFKSLHQPVHRSFFSMNKAYLPEPKIFTIKWRSM